MAMSQSDSWGDSDSVARGRGGTRGGAKKGLRGGHVVMRRRTDAGSVMVPFRATASSRSAVDHPAERDTTGSVRRMV
jgi:hypothetical protein